MSSLGRPDPSTELSRLLSASALIEKRCGGASPRGIVMPGLRGALETATLESSSRLTRGSLPKRSSLFDGTVEVMVVEKSQSLEPLRGGWSRDNQTAKTTERPMMTLWASRKRRWCARSSALGGFTPLQFRQSWPASVAFSLLHESTRHEQDPT